MYHQSHAHLMYNFWLHSTHIDFKHLNQQYTVFLSFSDAHLLQVFLFVIFSSGIPLRRGSSWLFSLNVLMITYLLSRGRFLMVKWCVICLIMLLDIIFKNVNLVISGKLMLHTYGINKLTLHKLSNL